ncbi:MAG: rhodanese-like domain-containing protein [Thermodesulfobacteriota bacterium]
MIQLRKLFTPVSSMDAEETKAYMAQHREDEYTILDVRQPWEYEDSHLPGAKLMPLPQLSDMYKELDPEKPTIVHCAIGGRSRVAAQMLSGWGFKEVYNLAGGIKAFEGPKATGPQELNLSLVRGDETPAEIITLAYGMEKALQVFYETLSTESQDQETKELFTQLARVEVRHEERLFEAYRQVEPGARDRESFEASVVPGTLEGGFDAQEFMESNKSHLQTPPQVLDLAMMLETQALDLYLRFADHCQQAQTREVLFALAGEEKAHLASLGRLLEEKLGKRG